MSAMAKSHCQSCDADGLQEISGFNHLPRVTSDSKPFRAGGRLFVCASCGLVQKRVDETWLSEIGEIYRDYAMYHQSSAIDQVIFDPVTGKPTGRCEVLARHLLDSGLLPQQGTLLDVGAGSGAMLGAFSGASRTWRLYGMDLDDRKAALLKAIPRFEKLYTDPPERVSQQFDLLTLVHSLEHFAEPRAMLRKLRNLMSASGHLFVQVNDVARTPFDLIVADHLCHFTPATLGQMTHRSGLGIALLKTDWVNKELSLVASAEPAPKAPQAEHAQSALQRTQADVNWLNQMREQAVQLSQKGPFAIFGTSVAATWLANGIEDRVAFFVDEDPGRASFTHMGRPIVKPSALPAGVTVYLAFVKTVAQSIQARLAGQGISFAMPDDTKR